MMLEEQLFFEKLENELPPVFTRNEVSKLTGGLIKPKTLSNLDALSKGTNNQNTIWQKSCL